MNDGLEQYALRWRVVAGLILSGLAANLVIIASAVTGIIVTVSERTMLITRLIPPAAERLWPMLEMMGRLRWQPLAYEYLGLLTVVSIVAAVGLWKTKKWAAWFVTFLMLFTIARESFGIVQLVRSNTSLSALVLYGRIPALLWATVYVVLLWTGWIVAKLSIVANFARQLRRERVET